MLAFLESGEQLRSASSSVLGALGDTLTEQCVVVLRQVEFLGWPGWQGRKAAQAGCAVQYSTRARLSFLACCTWKSAWDWLHHPAHVPWLLHHAACTPASASHRSALHQPGPRRPAPPTHPYMSSCCSHIPHSQAHPPASFLTSTHPPPLSSQLRGIVATFRMTKRAQPDRPSHYVSAILAPLQTFLSGETAGRLGPEARAHLTQVRAFLSQGFLNARQRQAWACGAGPADSGGRLDGLCPRKSGAYPMAGCVWAASHRAAWAVHRVGSAGVWLWTGLGLPQARSLFLRSKSWVGERAGLSGGHAAHLQQSAPPRAPCP